MTHFFAMGGYGWFIWSAYGVTAAALAAAVVLTFRDYFRAVKLLKNTSANGQSQV